MKPLDHRILKGAAIAEEVALRGESSPALEDLRQVLDSIPQMVWASFPALAGFEYYNSRWRDFTGRTLASDGSTRRDLIHPEDRERAVAAWNHCRTSGEPYQAEYRLLHASGEHRWILSRGTPERDGEGRTICWYGTCIDIHELVLARQALSASEQLNRTIIAASGDSIKLLDRDGHILFANAAAVAECGEDGGGGAAIGTDWLDSLPRSSRAAAQAALAKALAGERARFTTLRMDDPDEPQWRDYMVSPVAEGDGSGVVVSSRDVTEQRLAQERLRWTSNHDALTRLPNRAYFHECLEEAIRQANCAGRRIGLLIVDVDDLKQVNDALGHDAGDSLLCAFARRLKESVGDRDVVGRLGGDEFGIVLTQAETEAEVEAIAAAVIERLREPFVCQGRLLDCRGSIGASVYPEKGSHKAELLKHADLALYAAKSAGRVQAVMFNPVMRAEMQTRSSMLSLTRDAVRHSRIIPYYQPKVDLRTGKVSGFEALMRWRDRRGRIHLPATIDAAFEDRDLAPAITEQIVAQVAGDMARWLDEGVEFGHVAVNAAAADFRTGDFADRLLFQLRVAAVDPRYCQLEVTETVFLGRGAECVETALKQLSASRLRLALDDFGTGYASLSHLKRFPVDVLKIDRSFVHNLESDPEDAAIIRGVINLAKSLGLEVVAEGVETAAQQHFLVEHGCDAGQGFLYSKAVPAEEVPMLLSGPTEERFRA